MMNTPICDFIDKYIENGTLRFHMPGHKGKDLIGFEKYDITEINGADSLYEASGIIAESEKNASALFGADTFYSTEGSSHCIRAMLYLLKCSGVTRILAGRNAHKAFLSAVALLDTKIEWIYPSENESYLSGRIDLSSLESRLSESNEKTAVYITSPDYLGNIADIKSIAEICKRFNAFLAVDNAHGAYLKFLRESLHPIDLGADICCDSAHKTLPVITGGAYLHIAKANTGIFSAKARDALSLFGSTSPSYLILRSLDAANKYLSDGFDKKLGIFIEKVNEVKKRLCSHGYKLLGNEELKIVIDTKEFGYYGQELGRIINERNIEYEFCDRDHLVLMLAPIMEFCELEIMADSLCSVERRKAITEAVPSIPRSEAILTPREAIFAESERIGSSRSEGRILTQFNISCPPAVPIAVCGERINSDAVKCFEYYGITEITVKKLM